MKPLDLNAEVRRVLEVLERTIPKMISLVTDLAADLKPVKASASALEQIPLNLALNAKDAMPQGGRISFSTRNVELDPERAQALGGIAPGAYVRLTVADNGQGMPREVIDKVFDLVILDLGMPGMGGLACLEGVLALNPGQKAIIASGYSPDAVTANLLANPAIRFIQKPYRFADLLRLVRELLQDAPPRALARPTGLQKPGGADKAGWVRTARSESWRKSGGARIWGRWSSGWAPSARATWPTCAAWAFAGWGCCAPTARRPRRRGRTWPGWPCTRT